MSTMMPCTTDGRPDESRGTIMLSRTQTVLPSRDCIRYSRFTGSPLVAGAPVVGEHAVAVGGEQRLRAKRGVVAPFGRRDAEHLLDLRADVQRAHALVRHRGVGHGRKTLHDRAVLAALGVGVVVGFLAADELGHLGADGLQGGDQRVVGPLRVLAVQLDGAQHLLLRAGSGIRSFPGSRPGRPSTRSGRRSRRPRRAATTRRGAASWCRRPPADMTPTSHPRCSQTTSRTRGAASGK